MIDAAAALDPQPRSYRWTSLSYCVVDAIWSIGAHYDNVVVPLVARVAAAAGDASPAVPATSPPAPDPLPLPVLLARYPDVGALTARTNEQRTSTRNGIRKADAVLRYARILVEHQIIDLSAAGALLAGPDERFSVVDTALAAVPGDGQHGVRRGYLWMLCGSDQLVKPDRMVLRWIARHCPGVGPADARRLLGEVAAALTTRLGRPVTPWMLDHAIWQAERGRRGVSPPPG